MIAGGIREDESRKDDGESESDSFPCSIVSLSFGAKVDEGRTWDGNPLDLCRTLLLSYLLACTASNTNPRSLVLQIDTRWDGRGSCSWSQGTSSAREQSSSHTVIEMECRRSCIRLESCAPKTIDCDRGRSTRDDGREEVESRCSCARRR
jgi:hypothetical protein